MKRRSFLQITTSMTAMLLLEQQGLAELGGSVPPPLQVLPGPYGFLGTGINLPDKDEDEDEDDESKKDMEKSAGEMKDVGTFLMGVGGAIGMFGGAIAGATAPSVAGPIIGGGIASFGAGVALGGAAAFGKGMMDQRIANDPPRFKYQQDPNCKIVTASSLPSLANLDPVVENFLDSSFRLYASTANTLAALEYWQGAHAKNDSKWRLRHRENFVKSWNQMRNDGMAYPKSLERLYIRLLAVLKEAKIDEKLLAQGYRQNRSEIKVHTRKLVRNFVTDAKKKGLQEANFLGQSPVGLPRLLPGLKNQREAEALSNQFENRSKGLPVYK